jgi:CubicO group peptidase (beta-lactamase class C family)
VLAAAILERATGVHAEQYATQFLFEALGVSRYRWQRAPGDLNNGGSGLELRPRDLARFGQLYPQRGDSSSAGPTTNGQSVTAWQ